MNSATNYLYLKGKPLNYTDDPVGSNATAAQYYPYGQVQSGSTPAESQAFGSYVADESGLLYADQRYYYQNWGRFLTADPKGSSAHLIASGTWNRYSYAVSDTINSSDPSGLDPNCGPNMLWDGEGCTNGGSGTLPDASVASSINAYAVANSQGQQVNTGSSLGVMSADLTEAYNAYADTVNADFFADYVSNLNPPDAGCVQGAIISAATSVGLDLSTFPQVNVQIVNTANPPNGAYTETELNLSGASPYAMQQFQDSLCNLGFYSNGQCAGGTNNTSLVGPPHEGFTGNFRSPGLIDSVQVNTNLSGAQIDVDLFNPASIPLLGAILHAVGQWLPNKLVGTDNSYGCGP